MGQIIVSLIAFVTTFLIVLWLYFKWTFTYWKRRNVPFMKPTIPLGNAENPFARKKYIGFRVKERYDYFKSLGHKHAGLYMLTTTTYMPIDPEYIKNIMQKDFCYFMDRGLFHNVKDDPLTGHLFNLEGQTWKNLRVKLTPTFTSGKMKIMLPTVVDCAKQLLSAMDEFYIKQEPVDIKDISGCFTTDVIGSCILGLECNSFKNPNSEFRQHGNKIFNSVAKASNLSEIIALVNPKLARYLRLTITPKEVTSFFINVVKEAFEYRRVTNTVKKDFLQILMDLEDVKDVQEAFTIEELAAQAYIYFLAGYGTSSTTMTFCLFELALNPAIQQKVREEIFTVLNAHHEEITYEAIMDLKYLGQVIHETLRKYPPASVIPRRCVEDYKVPGTNVVIEKDNSVLIPVYALHYDSQYYPNPEDFDPSRFSEENERKRCPFTYLPFGDGPRGCIGVRFGQMQIKIALTMLLKNYRFSLHSKTKIPLEIDPANFLLSPKDGIWLDLTKLSD